ncbi:putative RNA-directed DNA polymerase [Tanacetum coccineum]
MVGDSGKSADKTKEGGIDHDSPYYLHPSDYPKSGKGRESEHSSKSIGGRERQASYGQVSEACVEAEKSLIAGFFKRLSISNNSCNSSKTKKVRMEKKVDPRPTIEGKRGYEQPVTIPNGEAVPVEGRGECALPSGAIIKDVLHVPKFKCNLLSVSRLSKELQCAVTFFPEFCIMQDLYSRTLIGAGDCEDGLYKMGMFENNRHAMMTTQTDPCGFLLEHNGSKLSICLVDFHKMVKVQFEKNIKRIRCDNGGEFVSNKMIDFYAREGIVLETSAHHPTEWLL